MQLLPGGGFDLVDRRLNYHYTDARWQQTANYGFLPNDAMPRTFLAVTIDLPDEIINNQSTHARSVPSLLATIYSTSLPIYVSAVYVYSKCLIICI